MDRELAQRAHAIFVQATDVPPERRGDFVRAACRDDSRLHGYADDILNSLEKSGEFLETPALGPARSGNDSLSGVIPAKPIGPYRIVRVLGVGGMATVYEAQQQQPARRVALKVMRQGFVRTSAAERFRYETEVLARLRHPGIAQIHDAGTCELDHGVATPYFAMEYLEDAQPITTFAQSVALPIQERLDLFLSICDAVQHGHLHGVIHRDLKPANIIVNPDGMAKVIDFGVARSTDPGQAWITQQSDIGAVVGTLNYMSPEQCAGHDDIDIRTDVYSLGVVLYELVTGQLPHSLSGVPLPEALRRVQEDTPAKPSAYRPDLARDLDAVVMKAIHREPARRFSTVAALADDIRRFLDHRPVLARPASMYYQVRMFARRNRAMVTGLAVFALMLISSTIIMSRLAYVANRQRAVAEERQRMLAQVAGFQESQFKGIDLTAMGIGMRAALLADMRKALESEPEYGGDEARVSEAMAEFERLSRRVNFTTLALDTLQDSVFERSLAAIDEQFLDQPLVRAQLLHAVAGSLMDLGRPDQARPSLAEAMRIRTAELGPNHQDTLESRHAMGTLLSDLGHPEEGLAEIRAALSARRKALGADHPTTLSTANSLGGALRRAGRYEEAAEVWRETLQTRRQTLGDNHSETLVSLNNWGVICAVQGDYAGAELAWRELVDRRREVLSADHPLYRGSLSNLGLLLLNLGKLEEARPLLETALASKRNQLGDDHPSTLVSMGSVAMLLKDLGEIEEAESLMQECLEGRLRTNGEDHPTTLRAMVGMSEFDRLAGRLDRAVQRVNEALAQQKRVLGDSHEETLASQAQLAALFGEMERFDESDSLFLATIDGFSHLLPPDHPVMGEVHGKYGQMLFSAGRYAQAERELNDAARILRHSEGDSSIRLNEVMSTLDSLRDRKPPSDPSHIDQVPGETDAGHTPGTGKPHP